MDSAEFHHLNTASVLLTKIGSGCTDADFARAVHLAVERASLTKKKAKVVLTVEVDPRDDTGSLVIRAQCEAKLPKLPAPATQMHVGPDGELLTQLEFLMGGGPNEAPPKAITELIRGPSPVTSGSGRLPVVPVAALPPPAPVSYTHLTLPTILRV